MQITGEEIRARLTRFAARWGSGQWGESKEAQTFLNELFDAYGMDRRELAQFEEYQAGGFLDLLWPGVCLVEMKASREAGRLAQHRAQAFGYWEGADDPDRNIPVPEYVVLCAFHRFEIWQPGRFRKKARAAFDLAELPDRWEALLFLRGGEPLFEADRAAVTVEAAAKLGELAQSLDDRSEGGPDERREFLLQCVWCMFAEDLGQLGGHRFTRLIDELISSPHRSSANDLALMFEYLDSRPQDRPRHGLYEGVPYANGRLFERPARLHLEQQELELLREVCRANWREVQPSIFGSLLQGVLGKEKQWKLGAHYTHEPEIQKIVVPTIVVPWTARIDALGSLAEARTAQQDLLNYVVLDPACGSGNFLYVAYRELRRIERDLARRAEELAHAEGRYEQGGLTNWFSIENMRGFEIDPFAVDLARVTLWMGHKLAVDELDIDERTLPLADLSGIRRANALQVPWPKADAIIGNPPYHGSQNLRDIYDEEYLEWLKHEFDVGLKDLCVYWFRRAADQMRPGDRAGLVGTNSISQNRARGSSLNYVVEKGGVITEAVSRQKWPGEAVVNVSIVNWIHEPEQQPTRFLLDGEEVAGISTRLRESKLAVEEFEPLPENAGRSFQGPIPAGDFYLEPDEAEELLARDDADYGAVVRPYLIGDDVAEDPQQEPRRYVIDFAFRSLEEAMSYPAALEIVRWRVKPNRDRNRDRGFRTYWWRFGRPRREMREALAPLSRYVAGNRIGKRFLFVWADRSTCPSDLVIVFAFDDDYAMGVLTSSAHGAWAHAEASTLRVDLRYTPTSCFESFPWPQPSEAGRAEIGEIARQLVERRGEICREQQIGLTDLYNLVDEGGYRDVADLHARLDRAVVSAYGWPASIGADPLELRARLADLHGQILAGDTDYSPFGFLKPAGAMAAESPSAPKSMDG